LKPGGSDDHRVPATVLTLSLREETVKTVGGLVQHGFHPVETGCESEASIDAQEMLPKISWLTGVNPPPQKPKVLTRLIRGVDANPAICCDLLD
jgi:hypothetical protein